MSRNITKQDAKSGLKRRYRLMYWPGSPDAESRWKRIHANDRLSLPGMVPPVCSHQGSQHSHLCQPALRPLPRTCPPTPKAQSKPWSSRCDMARSEELSAVGNTVKKPVHVMAEGRSGDPWRELDCSVGKDSPQSQTCAVSNGKRFSERVKGTGSPRVIH